MMTIAMPKVTSKLLWISLSIWLSISTRKVVTFKAATISALDASVMNNFVGSSDFESKFISTMKFK